MCVNHIPKNVVFRTVGYQCRNFRRKPLVQAIYASIFLHNVPFLIERMQCVLASLWILGPKSKQERKERQCLKHTMVS